MGTALAAAVGAFWGVIAALWMLGRTIERRAKTDLCLLCRHDNSQDVP